MAGTLKRRIREYARGNPGAGPFTDRLLGLTERIEREFSGAQQEQLLALASDTFDRHLCLRGESARIRAHLTRLRADRQSLLELLEFFTRSRGEDPIH